MNGGPLFYYDTVGYYDQGMKALDQLGLGAHPRRGAGMQAAAGGQSAVRTVDGSRSPFYSLVAALFARAGMFEGLLVLNAASCSAASGAGGAAGAGGCACRRPA